MNQRLFTKVLRKVVYKDSSQALPKDLSKKLESHLPNPELRKAFLTIDPVDWCIPRSTSRLSSRSKECVLCDLEKIQSI